jgi:hypothetical protein
MLVANEAAFVSDHKLASACLALMILFATMDMTVLL